MAYPQGPYRDTALQTVNGQRFVRTPNTTLHGTRDIRIDTEDNHENLTQDSWSHVQIQRVQVSNRYFGLEDRGSILSRENVIHFPAEAHSPVRTVRATSREESQSEREAKH
jgi:hypothetical protein